MDFIKYLPLLRKAKKKIYIILRCSGRKDRIKSVRRIKGHNKNKFIEIKERNRYKKKEERLIVFNVKGFTSGIYCAVMPTTTGH